MLASGSSDATVRLWDTEPARARWTARAQTSRWREQAQPLVDLLFETTAEREQVAEILRADATLDDHLRMAALQLTLTPPLPPNGVACVAFAGSALEFDGADSHVLVGSSDSLRMTDRFTVEAWIHPIDSPGGTGETQVHAVWVPSWETILNKEGEYQVARGPDGVLFWTVAGEAGWIPWVSLRYAAPAGRWTHLGLVRESRTIRAYLNGRLVQTFTGPGEIGDHHVDMDELRFGGRQHTELGFRGRIDEVRLWSVACSQEEIAASMRRSLTGREPGLIGYWTFDEGAGTIAHDLTGNHDGEVHKAAWHPTTVCDP